MLAQIQALAEEIRKTKARRVMLQIPEGLRTRAAEIIEAIEGSGAEALLSAEPVYGACDLADSAAAAAGCDLLVHVGHSRFYRDIESEVPVLYWPWEIEASLKGADFSAIKEKRIGVITTIQHMNLLNEVAALLRKAGKDVEIGGHVLGCWTANADKLKTDAVLFVGTGRFHPLGVKGTVYALDLEKMKIEKADALPFEKKRYANIYNARNAESFAILVSSKKGQRNMEKAEEIRSRLLEKDKKAYIVILDEIKDGKLLGLKAGAFINTACPRLADDAFSKPFVNACDIGMILEE